MAAAAVSYADQQQDQGVKNAESYPPIPQVHTVMLVNNFIVKTTEFVNGFASTCEEKLNQVSKRLTDVELTLALLEAKLNSVPGISELTEAPAAEKAPEATNIETKEEEVVVVQDVETTDRGMIPAREHPDYVPYFRLQRLGVPVPQIKMKMQADGGVDPAVFDDPELLLPAPSSSTKPLPPPPSSSSSSSDEDEDADFLDD